MSKQTKLIIWIGSLIAIITIAAPIYFYVKDFHSLPRSKNPTDWASFGDYLGGLLGPIISFLTLIVTIAIAIKVSTIEQRNHEETVHNPVKPFFVIGDGYFYSSDTSMNGVTVEKDYYDYTAPQGPAGHFDYLSKHFYLKLFNKGLGVAAEVVATFEIDLNELRQVLQFDDPRIKTTVSEVKTDSDGGKFIVLTIDAEKQFNYKGFFFKIWAKESVGLGVVDKNTEVPVVVPTQMMGAFQLQNLIRRFKDGDIVFPALFVTFDYKNIYGRAMTSKFRVGLFHINDYARYSVFRLVQEQMG